MVGIAPVALSLPSRAPRDLLPGGAFDRQLRQLASEDRISGTVLLSHHGRTVLARSYSMANRQAAIPNRLDTIFALASVGKLFTATAVVQLAERGKLHFGQPIGTYLDGFPPAIADTVTVHHLLTHMSGMGNYQSSPEYKANVASWTSGAAMLDGMMGIIRKADLLFTPGTRPSYSNSGYVVLGAIVQAVSGQPYHDYIREHVFAAAGMSRTDFYTRPQWLANPDIAHPYARLPSGELVDVLDRPDIAPAHFIGGPAGDAHSTAPDMVRFGRALAGARLLGPAYTHLALNGKEARPLPQGADPAAGTPFQAYGPTFGILNGQRVIGHGGGAPGKSTNIDIYLDSGWVTVMLFNLGDGDQSTPPLMLDLIRHLRQLIT